MIGATGAQGGSVVDALLADGKYKVRGATRDPESEKGKVRQDVRTCAYANVFPIDARMCIRVMLTWRFIYRRYVPYRLI